MSLDDFFDIPEEKCPVDELKENLIFLKNLSVEEQTFYKKWQEIQKYRDVVSNMGVVKSKIWMPIDINDETLTIKEIENCKPKLVYVGQNEQLNKDWTFLRVCAHTLEFTQTPGRFLKFLIVDDNKPDRPYLGVLAVSSDVISISDRDKHIGWTPDNKLKDKKLCHSAIGSSIMSTQPFGYNFLGGKLSASMIVSKCVQDKWKELYDQILVGMTTTSLYGKYSMYNSLKWWKPVGASAGKISIKPDNDIYIRWHNWIKENHPVKYKKMMTQKEGVSGPVTGAKSRVLSLMFSECKIKQSDFMHGFCRGVYYSTFYKNSKEFLRSEIEVSELEMKPLFMSDMDGILDWWIPKAVNRYKKLKANNNLKSKVLFYNKMIGMDYESSKKMFFNDVGR